MRPNTFTCDDSVLLLGEGNFSFSIGLTSLGIPLQITATCFESILSNEQTKNANYLSSLGVCVMPGIDATTLHEHDILGSKRFDKIIFNFPHTGGKMKIHLNRDLLRHFFISASQLLNLPGGCILVSLCRGQGADYFSKRTWADSWQVVDMAGHANLMLIECYPFQWTCFPSYTNVGYRSLQKGFHSEDAMVHKFCFNQTALDQHVGDVLKYYEQKENERPSLRPIHFRRIERNILEDDRNPISHVLNKFKFYTKSKFTCKSFIERDPFHESVQDFQIQTCALQMWREERSDLFLYSCYVLNKTTGDFNQSPVTIKTFFLGKAIHEVFVEFLQEVMVGHQIVEEVASEDSKIFRKIYCLEPLQETRFILGEYSFSDGVLGPILLVHVSALAKKFFNLKCWRQLWAENAHITFQEGVALVSGICPYPVTYTFDMTFISSEYFSEEKMFEFLWDLAGEVLVSVCKLSEFTNLGNTGKSICYRFSFSSYDHAVCRKTVLDFHQNGIGRAFQEIFHVQMK